MVENFYSSTGFDTVCDICGRPNQVVDSTVLLECQLFFTVRYSGVLGYVRVGRLGPCWTAPNLITSDLVVLGSV